VHLTKKGGMHIELYHQKREGGLDNLRRGKNWNMKDHFGKGRGKGRENTIRRVKREIEKRGLLHRLYHTEGLSRDEEEAVALHA